MITFNLFLVCTFYQDKGCPRHKSPCFLSYRYILEDNANNILFIIHIESYAASTRTAFIMYF